MSFQVISTVYFIYYYLKIQQSIMPKENVHQLAHFIQHSKHIITVSITYKISSLFCQINKTDSSWSER